MMSTACRRHTVTRVTHPYRGCDAVTSDVPLPTGSDLLADQRGHSHCDDHDYCHTPEQREKHQRGQLGRVDDGEIGPALEAQEHRGRNVLDGAKISNPISPNLLSGPERIAAVCEILATGLIRLRARKSSRISPGNAENFLDTRSDESGHAPKAKPSRLRHDR